MQIIDTYFKHFIEKGMLKEEIKYTWSKDVKEYFDLMKTRYNKVINAIKVSNGSVQMNHQSILL